MSKRENVLNLLNGKEFEYTPSGFWIHFSDEVNAAGVDAQVQAHRDFADATDMDIIKIMNENEFRSSNKVTKASEWSSIKAINKKDPIFSEQHEVMKKTLDVLDGSVYTLGTIHGVVASLSHSSGMSYSVSPEILVQHARENKTAVLDAIKATTENILNMLVAVQDTDVDGIYYAQLGAEKHRLPREFFDEFIKPYDLMILEEIKNKKTFLHLCKDNVDFDRFKDYPADVVNWAIHESEHSLKEGFEVFSDKTILGGLDDRSGELVDGSDSELMSKIDQIKKEADLSRFILGADCTLPTTIDYERIRFAVDKIK